MEPFSFRSMAPEQRTACARLLGVMLGSVYGLDEREVGAHNVLALQFAYGKVESVIVALMEELQGSYPQN